MNLGIVGVGHVGLVVGACLAEKGHQVACVDNDTGKIELLKQGTMPLYEPELEEMTRRNLKTGRLTFHNAVSSTLDNAEVIFISVGTPTREDGSADLSAVESVCRELAQNLTGYHLIVEKSTVPVRTADAMRKTLRLYNTNAADFEVASVPEFLREGTAIQDFLNPDRTILGVESPRAEAKLRAIFEPFGGALVVTDTKSAEFIKHASNSFLAMKISYINAIAVLCELAGADVTKVAEGMGYDKRIGRTFLDAGVGYGGACLPKDVAAFIQIANELGCDFAILKAAEKINREQRQRVVQKLRQALWVLRDKTVGILGLSFKPGSDDIREAPSLDIVRSLLEEGAKVKAYDPFALDAVRKMFGDKIEYCRDAYQVAEGAEALVIVTEWPEFTKLDLARIKSLMRVPVIVDGRNIFAPAKVRCLGFEYYGMGR